MCCIPEDAHRFRLETSLESRGFARVIRPNLLRSIVRDESYEIALARRKLTRDPVLQRQ